MIKPQNAVLHHSPNLHAIFNFHETNLTFPKNCTMRSKNRCKHWDEARKGKTFYYLLCICDGLWSSILIYGKIFNFIPVSIIYASKSRENFQVQVHSHWIIKIFYCQIIHFFTSSPRFDFLWIRKMIYFITSYLSKFLRF